MKVFLLGLTTLSSLLCGSGFIAEHSRCVESIPYYRCDYSKDNYHVVLACGHENVVTEVWGVDKAYIDSLPEVDLKNVNRERMIRNGAIHLEKRFPGIKLKKPEVQYVRINDEGQLNNRNWVAVLSFKYDKRGYYQNVPVLLDGRVVLSNNERASSE